MNNCFDNTRLLRVSLAALSKDYHFMKIKLTDIPQEGKKFTWSKESGELNKVLLDLIDDSKYEVEFYIHPLNHRDFQLSGRVQTELPEQCSHCGDDFQFAISEKFSAIITPKLHQPRGSKYTKTNHVSDSDDGPVSAEYENLVFDMGELLHEVIAIAIPPNPAPKEDCNGNCSLCGVKVDGNNFGYTEEMPTEEAKPNPFSSLKNLKLN